MRVKPTIGTDTNANVALTLTAIEQLRHELNYVCWSYSAAPTGGRLVVTNNGTTVFDVDITAGGPGALRLPDIGSDKNAAMVITLYAGGASVVGKLNVYAGART
jgi:hypothetical protein